VRLVERWRREEGEGKKEEKKRGKVVKGEALFPKVVISIQKSISLTLPRY
jgi:hypothetical protein